MMAASFPPDIKISAALVALLAPLREKYPRPTQIQTVIALTIAAWTLALTARPALTGRALRWPGLRIASG